MTRLSKFRNHVSQCAEDKKHKALNNISWLVIKASRGFHKHNYIFKERANSKQIIYPPSTTTIIWIADCVFVCSRKIGQFKGPDWSYLVSSKRIEITLARFGHHFCSHGTTFHSSEHIISDVLHSLLWPNPNNHCSALRLWCWWWSRCATTIRRTESERVYAYTHTIRVNRRI